MHKKILIFFIFLGLFFQGGLNAVDPFKNPLQEGHSVIVTRTTDETTFWKFELLKSANRSIEMSAGYVAGEVFSNLISLFEELLANKPDLVIHLYGSSIAAFDIKEQEARIAQLVSSYPERFFYLSTSPIVTVQNGGLYTTENHLKLLIIDEKYFLLGGTNLADYLSTEDPNKSPPRSLSQKLLPSASYDIDIVGSGPIVSYMRKEFFQIFKLLQEESKLSHKEGRYEAEETAYFPISEEEKTILYLFEDHSTLVKNVKMRAAISGPRRDYQTAGNIYREILDLAEKEISLSHMYFFPAQDIFDKLLLASRKGLKIQLITNGPREAFSLSGSSMFFYAYINRSNYLPLFSGSEPSFYQYFQLDKRNRRNVEVYEIRDSKILLHKKLMVVDRRYSVIGSYNLGRKSEFSDYEVAVVIDSTEVANQFLEAMEKDKGNGESVSFQKAKLWYFNPVYNVMELLEKWALDGTVL